MVSLSILSYFIATSPKKSRKDAVVQRVNLPKMNLNFTQLLPSTVGLTDIPEEFSTTDVKLPPRPAKTVRHKRSL